MWDNKSSCRSNFTMWAGDRKQGFYNWWPHKVVGGAHELLAYITSVHGILNTLSASQTALGSAVDTQITDVL